MSRLCRMHSRDDTLPDFIELIRKISEIFDIYGYDTEIIAASIRNPIHVTDCALAGADIIKSAKER